MRRHGLKASNDISRLYCNLVLNPTFNLFLRLSPDLSDAAVADCRKCYCIVFATRGSELQILRTKIVYQISVDRIRCSECFFTFKRSK